MLPEQNANGDFTATVTVKNTGDVDSAEIVQIYVSNPNSTYGAYAPKKNLVAFDKVRSGGWRIQNRSS